MKLVCEMILKLLLFIKKLTIVRSSDEQELRKDCKVCSRRNDKRHRTIQNITRNDILSLHYFIYFIKFCIKLFNIFNILCISLQ